MINCTSGSGSEKPSAAVFRLFTFIYGLMGFIFVPLGCWLYNVAADFAGGIRSTVSSVRA